MKKKGFTLIELIAVLVILAILALIVTPLVMNIVKKAKDSANKRSVDAYGKAVELAVATYLLDNGEYPSSLDNLTVEYSGSEVNCLTKTLDSNGSIYLSGCSVKNTEVLDSNNADGYYHYGSTSSNPATLETTYDVYEIGDEVTYNGINFYVIEDSDENNDSVKLLKAAALTEAEINEYGEGHINEYIVSNATPGVATVYGGQAGIAYYTSETCKCETGNGVYSGCTTDFNSSDIKYVVDNWSDAVINSVDIKEESRLITQNELLDSHFIEYVDRGGTMGAAWKATANAPSWVFPEFGWYWTMSSSSDSQQRVFVVSSDSLNTPNVCTYNYVGNGHISGAVRPVVTLYKSALSN